MPKKPTSGNRTDRRGHRPRSAYIERGDTIAVKISRKTRTIIELLAVRRGQSPEAIVEAAIEAARVREIGER